MRAFRLKVRDKALDFIRFFAIINMVAYHFIFNLNYFNLINYSVFESYSGQLWRSFIVTGFLLSVGISMGLSVARRRNFQGIKSSLFKIFLSAVVVSGGSYFIFPEAWIFFGILHFIFLAKIVLLPFTKFPFVALAAAIIIFIVYYVYGSYNPFNVLYGVWLFPKNYTFDMVNIIPWSGVVLLGIFLSRYPLYKIFFILDKLGDNKLVSFISRHSLIIYLLHQAILFPALWFVVSLYS